MTTESSGAAAPAPGAASAGADAPSEPPLRLDVLTLFPAWFEPLVAQGVVRRAFDLQRAALRLWPLRDFAEGTYRRVDDRTFGGGPGMVMMAPPLERALHAVRDHHGEPRARDSRGPVPRRPVVLFSPAGRPLEQARVEALAQGPGAILVCGRYEGLDQRFIDAEVDEEISLGDFVLSGGELAACALIDAVCRLLPGVLHDPLSHAQDSFSDGLLDCPHYTRPEVLPDGRRVPPVLLGGNHREIERWRREASLRLTARRRPDLIAAARAAGRLTPEDERFLSQPDSL